MFSDKVDSSMSEEFQPGSIFYGRKAGVTVIAGTVPVLD